MPFTKKVDIEELKGELQRMGYYVWSNADKESFFLAEVADQVDSAHVHVLFASKTVDRVLLTVTAHGGKAHVELKEVKGTGDDAADWSFETGALAFDGSQIATSLQTLGAKRADAESVHNSFCGLQCALAAAETVE